METSFILEAGSSLRSQSILTSVSPEALTAITETTAPLIEGEAAITASTAALRAAGRAAEDMTFRAESASSRTILFIPANMEEKILNLQGNI